MKDKEIVLSMVEGKVYAMYNICTHRGRPLNEDELKGYDLKCPWHYAVLTSGMEKSLIGLCALQI